MSNNQFNLHYEAELNEGIRVTTLSPIFCSGDIEAHSFVVKVTRNGKPVNLAGTTVRGFFIRPDNVTITLEGSVNADGEAVVTLSNACYNKQGRFQLVIRVTMGGVISTVFCGLGGMLLTVTDGFIDEDNVIPSLDDLLAQIDTMNASTMAAVEAAERANEAADRANDAANNAGSGTGGGSYEFTEEDQEAIVQQVLVAMGLPVLGTVDADKNITLTTALANGTYTIMGEGKDGALVKIGTWEVGESEAGDDTGDVTTYTNLAAPASADWVEDYRINSSGSIVGAYYGCVVANFIPCKAGDVVRVKGMDIAYYQSGPTDSGKTNMWYYKADKTTSVTKIVVAENPSVFVNDGDTWTFTVGNGLSGDTSAIAYIRPFGRYMSGYTKDSVIITVNEEIA